MKNTIKKLLAVVLAITMVAMLVPFNMFADTNGEVKYYVGSRYENEFAKDNGQGYYAQFDCGLLMYDENDSVIDEELVYCYNKPYGDPTGVKYTKTYENASAEEFWNSALNQNLTKTNDAEAKFKNIILWIVKLGAPYNDGNFRDIAINELGIDSSYADSALRLATQYAIWNMADSEDIGKLYDTAKKNYYTEIAKVFDLAMRIVKEAKNRASSSAPQINGSDMELDIYTPNTTNSQGQTAQNLLATRVNTNNQPIVPPTPPTPPVVPADPEISTTATVNRAKSVEAKGEVTIVDKVDYTNLDTTKTYVLEATLMSKADSSQVMINGVAVAGRQEFQPQGANGSINVELVIADAEGLKGEVVVFESLKVKGETDEVASHKDINDLGQTVEFTEPQVPVTPPVTPPTTPPAISTTATVNGVKSVEAKGEVTIVDEVRYENLDTTKTYVLEATLMNKADGSQVMVNGAAVVGREEFQPQDANGSINVELVVSDAEGLKGEVVVFESLKVKGETDEVASHKDINDLGQTVEFTESQVPVTPPTTPVTPPTTPVTPPTTPVTPPTTPVTPPTTPDIPEEPVPGGPTPEEPVVPEEPQPEEPFEDEEVPGGELPYTGGIMAELLYGLGAMLMMSGVVIGRRKEK